MRFIRVPLTLLIILSSFFLLTCSSVPEIEIPEIILVSNVFEHNYIFSDFMGTDSALEEKEATSFISTDYNPFYTADPMEIWKEVYFHVDYERDTPQDNWQVAKETYDKKTGDCDDHAILLTSCLIAEGYDAFVVLGNVNGGPKLNHAYVLLFKENEIYYFDPTTFPWRNFEECNVRNFPNLKIKYIFNNEVCYKNTDW